MGKNVVKIAVFKIGKQLFFTTFNPVLTWVCGLQPSPGRVKAWYPPSFLDDYCHSGRGPDFCFFARVVYTEFFCLRAQCNGPIGSFVQEKEQEKEKETAKKVTS